MCGGFEERDKIEKDKQTKSREFGIVGIWTNVKRKQKAVWGKKGYGKAF